MRKLWWDDAWIDYIGWQAEDRKTLRRINLLIKDIERNGYAGIGNPICKRAYSGIETELPTTKRHDAIKMKADVAFFGRS